MICVGNLKGKRVSLGWRPAALSALAAYIAKRVEISLSQLQMNRVAISLYEVEKTTSEIRDVFKVTYEDRPYICLSGSERIRAGLESLRRRRRQSPGRWWPYQSPVPLK